MRSARVFWNLTMRSRVASQIFKAHSLGLNSNLSNAYRRHFSLCHAQPLVLLMYMHTRLTARVNCNSSELNTRFCCWDVPAKNFSLCIILFQLPESMPIRNLTDLNKEFNILGRCNHFLFAVPQTYRMLVWSNANNNSILNPKKH